MKIVMISRLDDRKALDYTTELSQYLISKGHDIIYEAGTASAIGKDGIDFPSLTGDMAVVIGGDGSVLHTVQEMSRQMPILGINMGKVGFLADLEPDEAYEFFSHIEKNGFHVEKRMRISLSVNGKWIGHALNEAVIVTLRPAKMLYFSVIVDGIAAESFRADGLLISTPTGSTAYAMSAGGPIVDPRIEGFLLVPLAPYMLSSRPHLISNDRVLKIELESQKPASLVIDGQDICKIHNGAILTVEMSDEPALFVDVGRSFFVKVDSKLRRL